MSSGDRPISLRELESLSTAFLRLPGIRDHGSREMYIDMLSKELDTPIAFPRHSDPRHDVSSMLYACLDHQGAIRKLAAIVRHFHRDSMPMRDLDELIEYMFPDEFLGPDERDELLPLLADIDPQWLLNAFRYAGPPVWQTTVLDVNDPLAIVQRLESCVGGPDSAPPLLIFVDYLAHQLDSVRSAEQHRWLDKIGVRKSVPASRLRDLCVSSIARLGDSRRYYFMVQLQADGVDPQRYLLSVWLQRYLSVEEPLYRSDEPRSLGDIVELLPDLLRRAQGISGVGVGDMTVEFIMPRSLIGIAVDQWQIDKVFPHALGTSYSVVVRSLERMRNRGLHGAWQGKWRWLSLHGHREDPDAIFWLQNRWTRDPDALRRALLREDSTVALAMNFPPGESSDLQRDELTAALYAGIPIIVWCRNESLGNQFRTDLRSLLAGRGLLELPAQLLRLRREPDDTSSALGGNVTLLFDDFDRLPESFTHPTRLQAPQKR